MRKTSNRTDSLPGMEESSTQKGGTELKRITLAVLTVALVLFLLDCSLTTSTQARRELPGCETKHLSVEVLNLYFY